jgi:hypothetical protein
MTLKSKGPITIDPGEKIKKKNKKKISMNKSQLLNVRASGDKMKKPISTEETTLFQVGLFILSSFFLEQKTRL